VKNSGRHVITSVLALTVWLIGNLFFPGLNYGSLLILLIVANWPWLVARITSIELPWGVKINFSQDDKSQTRESKR
jgi:hypothetical protein